MKVVIAIGLLLTTTPTAGREKLARVPFVGCPADGQTGPIPAPAKSGKAPSVQKSAAAKLAYYSAESDLGVLAPRGWHCLELYGSSGAFMIVTPERHRADEFFKGKVLIRGPAVQRSVTFGGTSGRYGVAEQISRYFPARMSFVRKVVAEDRELGVLAANPLRGHGYKNDLIKRRTASSIWFTTPGRKAGEGTYSRLVPGNLPIDGLRKVIGPKEEPDLVSAEVRLPSSMRWLAPIILSDVAK